MKKFIIIAVASFFVCLQSAYPQISTNELPVSIQRELGTITKGKTTGTIDLPVPDIKKLLQEDSLNQEKNPNGILRTAVSIPVVIDIDEDGIWTTLADGGRLWQMEIHAEKALALDFVFSKFWLPKEGKFFLFNPSTKETIGAITSQYLLGDKNKPHRFSTGVLKGDKIILEYYQPEGEQELPIIKVEKAYYTYIPVPNFLSTSTCSYEVNVNCSEGDNWQLDKNAVALVYCKYGTYGAWCSGSLLNNTQNNLLPLFLTANHCMGTKDALSDNDLSDWVFYWGYELENCSSTTQPDYSSKTTVGATLNANNSYSDFALLQLIQDPINIPGYIPYYLGWDVSGSSGTGGVCIHHPNHDVKKISTYSSTPQTISYNSSYVYWGVQWVQTVNGHGITEEGSSGAPLINNGHKVIGQLTGTTGSLSCSNLTGGMSGYGKLSVSWTGNGNYDYRRRLNCWLNPNGTNIQSINGLDPYSLSGPSYICSSSTGTYTINNLSSSYNVVWYFSDGFGPTVPTIQSSGNTCTITNNLSKTYVGTLNAAIYYNGTLLKTLKKEQIIVYSGFYGLYCIGSGTPNQVFYPSTTIWVTKGSTVHLKSPNLLYKNVSYSVTTPSSWQYYSYTGEIYVTYPNVTSNNPILINVQNNTSYSNCDNSYQIVIMPNNVLPSYSLSPVVGGGQITVSLVEKAYSDEVKAILETFADKIPKIDTWTLEVYQAGTGKKIFSKEVSGTSYTIDTTGWEPGVYIIKAIIGEDTLSEKVVVK